MNPPSRPGPTRCPMCGFGYDWGRNGCGHCGFPASGRRRWDQCGSLRNLWTAAEPVPARRVRLLVAGCFRRTWHLVWVPDGGPHDLIAWLEQATDATAPHPAIEFAAELLRRPPPSTPGWLAARAAAELTRPAAPTLDVTATAARHLRSAARDRTYPPRDWASFELPPDLEPYRNELARMPNIERYRLRNDPLDRHGLHRALVALDTASQKYATLRARCETDEERAQCDVFRDIMPYPFEPIEFDPAWRTTDAVAVARRMEESGDYSPMPILADALQDAGCDNDRVLAHCRGDGPHVRGCWVVDLVQGRR